MRNAIWTLLLLLATAVPAAAQGLMIPDEKNLPPLALVRHRVTVDIDGQAATTLIEQIFANHTDRQLEAQYIFPIPRGAAMSRFTMMVNGKEKAGDIVEKNEARRIYNSIVQRSQDPGLLEYLGGELFRANIFPIPARGTQTITLRINQVLTAQDGLVGYVYAARAGMKQGPAVQGEFSMEVNLKSAAPILSLYSPSHAVNVARANDREARVSFSDRKGALEKDFLLYYGFGDKEVGLNLVTYRPDPKQPGYFMMLLAPRSTMQAQKIVERDLVFVVDTSGSMAGEKIQQARSALKYLVSKLNDGDRFNIVTFASYAEAWQKGLVSARERREDAIRFADTLLAQGGTDIAGALDAALGSLKGDASRPGYVVFMTDGKPTMGETTDPKRILAKTGGLKNVRIFTWGVGYDVDTHLLDLMAGQAGGVSEYVRPEEDIAAKVAAFANKASQPVLTGLDLRSVGAAIQLSNTLPNRLPDLHAGGQIVVLGRYSGEGDAAFQLSGDVNGKAVTFTYEGKFPATSTANAFIELLWAQRRIGFLLDQIRLHGESKELVDDVIRLSKEYGLQTPYTSSLILDDLQPVTLDPRRPRRVAGGESDRKLDSVAPAPSPLGKPQAEAAAAAEEFEKNFKAKDGKAGVDVAKRLRELKETEQGGQESSAFRKAASTRFFQHRGLWIDEKYKPEQTFTEVKFGSEAYFALLERAPELIPILRLGKDVLWVMSPTEALVVCANGPETLAEAAMKRVVEAAKR